MRNVRLVPLMTLLALLGFLVGHVFGIDGQRDPVRGEIKPVFATLEGKGKKMPRRLSHAVRKALGKEFAGRTPFADAHHLPTAVGGGLWMVRMTEQTCIVSDRTAAAACAPNVKVDRWGIAVGTGSRSDRKGDPRGYFVFGIAPDKTRSVKVQMLGESTLINVPIMNNTYSIRSRKPIFVTRLNHR